MSLQPNQDPQTLAASPAGRQLRDPEPEFLAALFGFNRPQVRRWVAWQQQLLARSRARNQQLEAELLELRAKLARPDAGALQREIQFELPPTGAHVGSRRPRHLRRERDRVESPAAPNASGRHP